MRRGEVKIDKTLPVKLEMLQEGDFVIFNIIFIETGEIRQKRRSLEWVMKRIFYYELKTWNRNWNEILKLEQ